jgi:hypothetical protein
LIERGDIDAKDREEFIQGNIYWLVLFIALGVIH